MPETEPGYGARAMRESAVLFRPPRRRLRAGLTQAGAGIVGLACGLLLPGLPPSPGVPGGVLVTVLFTTGFGVLGLAGLIFSLLFLVVQFTSNTFTPRLNLFREDPIVWRTFAVVGCVFIYAITAALAVAQRHRVSIVVPVAALLLVLVAVLLMRTVQVHALVSLRLVTCLDAINRRTREVHDTLYVTPYAEETPARPEPPGPGTPVRWRAGPVMLQQVNVPALVAAAIEYDAVIVLRAPIGRQLFDGDVLAEVHRGDVPAELVLRNVLTGPERSFDQDVTFGPRLLADIALRALSIAVNDPETANEALDHLHDLLRRVVGKDLDIGHVADGQGRDRVIVPLPGWEDHLGLAFDEAIVAARYTPMVLTHIRGLLRALHDEAPGPRKDSIAERLRRVEERLRSDFPWEAAA